MKAYFLLILFLNGIVSWLNAQVKPTNKQSTNGRMNLEIAKPKVSIASDTLTELNAIKREPLTPTQQMTRDFNLATKGVFYGMIMHSLDRILSGEKKNSEWDRIVEKAMANNPQVSKEMLTRLVTDFKAVPGEIRAKAMPMELVTLDKSLGISINEADRFRGEKTALTKQPILNVSSSLAAFTIRSAGFSGRDKVWALLPWGYSIKPSTVVLMYIKPSKGWTNEDVFTQIVDGERVLVVIGKALSEWGDIEGELPRGLLSGKYKIAVRVARDIRGKEPKSQWVENELGAYGYSYRINKIKCIDESDPEKYLDMPAYDDIKIAWAAYGIRPRQKTETTRTPDGITAYHTTPPIKAIYSGLSQTYYGFKDGVEKIVHDGTELVPAPYRPDIQAVPPDDREFFPPMYVVGGNLFVVAEMWVYKDTRVVTEWTSGHIDEDNKSILRLIDFFLDIANQYWATKEQDDNYLEIVSESLHWAIEQIKGSREAINVVKLRFSEIDLEIKTKDNDRYVDFMDFISNTDKGRYRVEYEIRRERLD